MRDIAIYAVAVPCLMLLTINESGVAQEQVRVPTDVGKITPLPPIHDTLPPITSSPIVTSPPQIELHQTPVLNQAPAGGSSPPKRDQESECLVAQHECDRQCPVDHYASSDTWVAAKQNYNNCLSTCRFTGIEHCKEAVAKTLTDGLIKRWNENH